MHQKIENRNTSRQINLGSQNKKYKKYTTPSHVSHADFSSLSPSVVLTVNGTMAAQDTQTSPAITITLDVNFLTRGKD